MTNGSASSPQSKTFLQRYGFPLFVLALCVALGLYLWYSLNKEEELPVNGVAPAFTYTDVDGNNVSLADSDGKVRLLYFFFAFCPDVCPPTTAIMSQVQDELKEEGLFGNKVQFLSVTIDPTRDTPEVLTEFADRFDADSQGWSFLRGDEQATFDLAEAYKMMAGKDKDGNFYHSNLIVLIDQKGQIRDWISANDYFMYGDDNLPASDMTKLIKRLL